MDTIENVADKLCGGYWNTRVIKKHIDGKYENGEEYHETYMGIFEVYYDKNNNILGWSENPIQIQFEDLDGFSEMLRQQIDALKKPVLEVMDNKVTETSEILFKGE